MTVNNFQKNSRRGFAAFLMMIFVLAIMLGIGTVMMNLTFNQQRISNNVVKSSQAYYAAESGLEDAILRLTKGENLSDNYGFSVGDSWVTTTVTDQIGGIKTIVGEGNDAERIRKVMADYRITADGVAFYYGAQVGNGGMIMGNNSRVEGNVFSNGTVYAPSGTGYIDNSIIVAGAGNQIENLSVGGDATVHTCKNSAITGHLTYVSGGSVVNCTAGASTSTQPNDVAPESMPISSSQITQWESGASAGGIINNDVNASGTLTLGPAQIGTAASPKNLVVGNNATLSVKGTLYVTGNVVFSQNSKVQLDPSYGAYGGIIIADGTIDIENGVTLGGSGQTGSYLLIISTNDSLDPSNPAINVKNNAQGAIIYTSAGLIYLKNLMQAREITGYMVQIENNAVIQYESGLIDASFTGGSGGSWKITTWQETE